MISLADYFMGRRETFGLALTPDIERNAARTALLVGQLLDAAAAAGLVLPANPRTGTVVSSGWRPPALNAATPGAAVNSKHMTGLACDVYDPDGDLDEWLAQPAGEAALVRIGLWIEHPSATKGWCHLQTVPPRSGRRVFYP